MNSLFGTADILIPVRGTDIEKWAVIACDQHSSEPEYWDKLDNFVGNAPSTLRMMLPEAYLGKDTSEEAEKIHRTMYSYLESGIFRELKDSYIYVERTLPSGAVRRGLIGGINLNEYDYSSGSASAIRATEGTVEDRLPPRVKVRNKAPLEMPHVMVFSEKNIFSEINPDNLIPLYDSELNFGGGHIRGWQISGKAAADVTRLTSDIPMLAIGDGNHSLATAKLCGDSAALAELVCIYDPAIVFEPIHRVIFETDTSYLPEKIVHMDTVQEAEAFCQSYVDMHGGRIDYIHNDETAIELGSKPGCAAFLLPAFNKNSLFRDILSKGPYPKKSFSMGHAEDKRYYLECRRIH